MEERVMIHTLVVTVKGGRQTTGDAVPIGNHMRRGGDQCEHLLDRGTGDSTRLPDTVMIIQPVDVTCQLPIFTRTIQKSREGGKLPIHMPMVFEVR